MKITRRVLIVLGILAAIVPFTWIYTSVQLASARSKGLYSSPEQGMQAIIAKGYTADRNVKILYAGTNSFDGSQPHIWYVIAQVRASARADGSALGKNGCDAPGLFFLQTKEGWVFVPEGAFPAFIGFWMKAFGTAGPGQSTPSTNWAPDQPSKFCQ
jgi:hypothetical protein